MAVYDSIRINEGGELLRVPYRNFSAREAFGTNRITFCVKLENDNPNMFYGNSPLRIDDLVEDGWNVKELAPEEDGDPVEYYIQVEAKYINKDGDPVKNPPRVVVTTGEGKVELDESNIAELDSDNIVDARMIIRPYEYKPGHVKAYLKTLFVKVDGKIHFNDDTVDDFDKF